MEIQMKSYKILLALLIVTNIYYFNSYGSNAEEAREVQEEVGKSDIQDAISKLQHLVSTILCAKESEKQDLIDEAKKQYSEIMDGIRKNIPVTESIKFTHELSKIKHKLDTL